MESRLLLQPFAANTPRQKVPADAGTWNPCEPVRVTLAYTPVSTGFYCVQFFPGRLGV